MTYLLATLGYLAVGFVFATFTTKCYVSVQTKAGNPVDLPGGSIVWFVALWPFWIALVVLLLVAEAIKKISGATS